MGPHKLIDIDSEFSLPFPIEFVINDTPRSHQSRNATAKESWKEQVKQFAKQHVENLRKLYFLDERPLAITIFYFPPAVMQGDVDNIVKLILDGMISVIYLNDRVIERVLVQKFEPGIDMDFKPVSPILGQAVESEPPMIYIRVDDDLSWRQLP